MYVDYSHYGAPFSTHFNIVSDGSGYKEEVLRKCDFLMLSGGADINPEYYNQKRSSRSQAPREKNNVRDVHEERLALKAIELGKPIIGICRGAQWLSILSGGTLVQHVTNHYTDHDTETYDGKTLDFTSAHHQMCNLRGIPHQLLAWTNHLSTLYLGGDDEPVKMDVEPEVFYIPSIKGFGIQGHPEFSTHMSPMNQWIRSQLDEIFFKG